MARRATMVITGIQNPCGTKFVSGWMSPAIRQAIPLAPQRGFGTVTPDVAVEVRRRLGVEDEFLLFAGTIEPRKNLVTLVRAFEEVLRTTELRPQLVVAGKIGWKSKELLAQYRRA